MLEHEGLRRIWVVTAREFRERGRTKAFQWSTLLVMLGMVALIVIPAQTSDTAKTYRVGLAGVVAAGTTDALAAQAAAADRTVRTTTYPTVAAGEQAVRDKKVDVLLVDGKTLEWRLQSDAALATLVGNAVQAVNIRERATQQGLSMTELGSLLAPITLSSRQLASAAGVDEHARDVAFYAIILLFIAVSLYGNMVLTGVVQEKQSRVAEVLLARMRPRELLAGKLLGIGALGLGQFALIVATAAVSLAAVDRADTPHVATSLWIWFVVWFVLGFALYSSLYGAFGALASRVEDASAAAAPISILLFGAYFATMSAIQTPDSALTTVMSFVPVTAPMAMPLRMTLTTVPMWQVAVAALLTASTVWLLVRLAGRVYTGAVLRTGTKTPLTVAWRGGAR